MKNLLEQLNFPISTNKLVSPTHQATCLGKVINTTKQILSIPDDKMRVATHGRCYIL